MNKVILVGRLTKDAEFKLIKGENRGVLNFTIAINRDYINEKNEREADFIQVSYWSNSGETLKKYLTKGRLIYVTGRINVKSYDSQEGIKKYVTSIVADEIQFLDNKKPKEVV